MIRDPLRRLGSSALDVQELEAQAFFVALDFNLVYNKEYTPLYKPNIGAVTDTANFDPQFTAEAAVDSHVDSGVLQGQPNQFEGFSYADSAALDPK